MSDYLDELGRQLRSAAERHPHQRTAPVTPRRPSASARALVAVMIMALVLTAGALAATGVLRIGSPVRPPRGASPTAGAGLPAAGTGRLLAIRVPDPAGGPPWGMRVIHTTRGLVCVQIGRVYRGQLGLLGRDGAFGNDGRFHPLPANALGQGNLGDGGAASNIQTCDAPSSSFSQSASGISASGVFDHTSAPPGRRWISYGLLGPHARAVTYRSGGRRRSEEVLRPLGAYLIVLPGTQPGETSPESGGSSASGQQLTTPRARPTGAVTQITYRFGSRTCTDADRPGPAQTCPLGRASTPVRLGRNLHQPIAVSLRDHDGEIDAIVSFTAPYPVASALHSYVIESPNSCSAGDILTPLDRDIDAGQRVRVTVDAAFANACGATVTLRVVYQSNLLVSPGSAGQPATIGQVTIRRPR